MALDPVERLNYYQHQYVGAEDFRDQQAYHRDALRRHELGPHSWGIVTGCTLVEIDREGDDPFVDVYLLPGTAVDGFGRKIVVLEPVKIDPGLFSAYHDGSLVSLALWMLYDEVPARTATGGFAPCTDAEAFGRLTETYRFIVATPRNRDPIMVAGIEASLAADAVEGDPVEPEDGSVPYQDFPDSERAANWPILLGTVRWHGTARKFSRTEGTGANDAEKKKNADRIRNAGRHYAGFIGCAVLAEGPELRFAPRTPVVDRDIDPFASIEGQLRVDGRITAKKDVFLHGGKVSWQGDGGTDSTPLWIQRLPGPNGGADLRIHIGDTADKDSRLTIGPGPTPATEKVVLAVAGDDKVHVPTGELHFDGQPRQVINVKANGQRFGLGVQDETLYVRSPSGFVWYQGGAAALGQFDSGGGAEAMLLDGSRRLTVPGGVRSLGRVELWGTALDFRTETGSTDTDPMEIQRINTGSDTNDLRITIGDNLGGGDRLVVGPLYAGDGGFREQLIVENWGDVKVGRDLHVTRALYVGGRKALIDVMAGEIIVNQLTWGTGMTTAINLVSPALATVSSVEIIVALSDIGNAFGANDARWRVGVVNKTLQPPNGVSFNISWTVGDSDGHLHSVSYVAIFRP